LIVDDADDFRFARTVEISECDVASLKARGLVNDERLGPPIRDPPRLPVGEEDVGAFVADEIADYIGYDAGI
jgi:hypothetical protein